MRPYTDGNKMLKFHLFRTLPITLPNKKGQSNQVCSEAMGNAASNQEISAQTKTDKERKKKNKSQTRLSYFIGEINDGSKNQEMFKSNYTYISTVL